MKPIVKNTLIGAGIVVLGFIAYKAFGQPSTLSPLAKMTLDVLNPNTPFGAAQRRYLTNQNLPFTDDNLKSAIGPGPWMNAYNSKQAWGANEIVNV